MTKTHAISHLSGHSAACRQSLISAESVVRSFDTWAYKREKPSDAVLMLQSVQRAIANSEPILFVLYWGKGPRQTLGGPDNQCLDYLASMGERIAGAYAAGASFTLILTDTHARLNEHTEASIESYYEAIAQAGYARGFQHVHLSDLVRKYVPPSVHSCAEPVPTDVLERLTLSAMKWYGGDDTPNSAALQYFEINMQEKRAVEQRFPGAIFLTFNNSQYRLLFPASLPIFYMYSIKKGTAVKPWFLAGTPAASAPAGAVDDRK